MFFCFPNTAACRNKRMRRLAYYYSALLWATGAWVLAAASVRGADDFKFTLRERVLKGDGSGEYRIVTKKETWPADKTAIIVCDMWDLHHCKNAVTRVKEMAPRMNAVLEKARARGALIIHAPSSCMEPYKDHPARRRAQQASQAANLPPQIDQ